MSTLLDRIETRSANGQFPGVVLEVLSGGLVAVDRGQGRSLHVFVVIEEPPAQLGDRERCECQEGRRCGVKLGR
jgi:hypothetical protein